MDRTKTYILTYEDDHWECRSEDFQESGTAYDDNYEDTGMAAMLAVAECAGFDIGIIAEELGF